MKKICLFLISVCFALSLCACSSTDTVEKHQEAKADEKGATEFKIGDEVYVKKDDGEYKFTITGVAETDERNQFAEKNPNRVILISYSYENISKSTELYISDMNFKAYDKDNNAMDTYPAVAVDYPQSVSAGRKSSGQMAYGLNSEENYVELEFYDNVFMGSECKIILEW